MNKIIYFGENVAGYKIPVLNEREVRAAAGILFLLVFTSFMMIMLKQNFLLMKYAITLFLTDFVIRVFINPKYSPTLIIGRLIVSRQNPEYVGAAQKKFAWIVGLVLSSTMFVLMVIINAFSPITGIICMTCLVFLFFESVFGICLGCLFYSWFYKEKAQHCPGEVCDVKSKQDIQKTSWTQLLIILGFAVYIFLTAFLFNNNFNRKPYDMFGIYNTSQSK